MEKKEKKKVDFFGIILGLIIVGIIASVVISSYITAKTSDNQDKNQYYYEMSGVFDEANAKLTKAQYDEFEKLMYFAESEIEKINVGQIYCSFAKKGGLTETFMLIVAEDKYIEISLDGNIESRMAKDIAGKMFEDPLNPSSIKEYTVEENYERIIENIEKDTKFEDSAYFIFSK